MAKKQDKPGCDGREISRSRSVAPTPAEITRAIKEINSANRKFWSDARNQWQAALIAVDRAHHDTRRGIAVRGGKRAADVSKSTAATWHRECVGKARKLLEQGKPRRSIAGILATNSEHDVATIRKVLKKAGV